MDWREIFKRHLKDVVEKEGIYFIYEGSYSLEEMTQINQVIDEIQSEANS